MKQLAWKQPILPFAQTLLACSQLLHWRLAGKLRGDPTSASANSTQVSVLSRMNEQLAAENAALVAELAKLQHRQHRQTASLASSGPIFQNVETVGGIPVDELASLLAPPGATPSGDYASQT